MPRNPGRILSGMVENFEDQVSRHNEAMSDQLRLLDDSLGRELEQAIQQLGSHLVGLHTKVAQDYEGFTKAMTRVIEVAKRVNP